MAVVGNVVVKFGADTAEYSKGSAKVRADNAAVGESIGKLKRDAQKLTEETRTPAEKVAQDIAKINRLAAAGLIDQETRLRAVTKAQAGLGQDKGLLGNLKALKEGMEKSGFNTLLETLKGGALFAGVTYVIGALGKGLNDAGDAAREFKNGLTGGLEAAVKITDAFLDAIPVLSQLNGLAKGTANFIDALAHPGLLQIALPDPEIRKAEKRQNEDIVLTYKQMQAAADDYFATANKTGLSLELARVRVAAAGAFREVERLNQEVEHKRQTGELQPGEQAMEAGLAVDATRRAALAKLRDDTLNALTGAAGGKFLDLGGTIAGGFTRGLDAANAFFGNIGGRLDYLRSTESQLARATADRLAAQGQMGQFAAQELQVKQHILDRELELRKLVNDPKLTADAKARAQAELDALPKAQAQALANNELAKRDAVRDREREIASIVMDRLNAAAALGNEEAKLAAARLQVEQQIADKRARLDGLANDATLPEHLRRAAKEEMARLPAVQQQLLATALNTPAAPPSAQSQLSAQFTTNSKDRFAELVGEAKKQTGQLDQLVQFFRDPWKVFNI